MQQAIRILFSPLAFALGFFWPLTSQVLLVTSLVTTTWIAWVVGLVIAGSFGLVAQKRGSWIWIRS